MPEKKADNLGPADNGRGVERRIAGCVLGVHRDFSTEEEADDGQSGFAGGDVEGMPAASVGEVRIASLVQEVADGLELLRHGSPRPVAGNGKMKGSALAAADSIDVSAVAKEVADGGRLVVVGRFMEWRSPLARPPAGAYTPIAEKANDAELAFARGAGKRFGRTIAGQLAGRRRDEEFQSWQRLALGQTVAKEAVERRLAQWVTEVVAREG